MKKKSGREQYLRGKLIKKNNELYVNKYNTEGAGILISVVWSEVLIKLELNTQTIKVNDKLQFFPYENWAMRVLDFKGLKCPIPVLKAFKVVKEEKEKLDITKSMIQPIKEIKSLGKFKVKVSLHSEIDAEIHIIVESAETIQ